MSEDWQRLAQRCDYQVKCKIYTSEISLESGRVLILFGILRGKQTFVCTYHQGVQEFMEH